ncbi:DoxX family protein [Paenibacillus tundrae]|uniref:Thiosulfate dehydrogenase [quinone] large subunit n=1 Tax=Paenibacillus tundrae TaxID=528187 RepID=A0ABT9WHW0_9BACL|nr:DoxX family protein [Paenibacillus tundrae]MDQ0172870.1 thiosulfate dehydrogenase [quinone] large subunit [Paenibacillus tundrae]
MFSFNQWLRENKVAMWILTVLRVYIGYDWMMHGWDKLTGGFQAGGFLAGALEKTTGDHPAVQAWWGTFLEKFAVPNAGLFDFVIPLGEFLVGLGLILGCFTTLAALMAMVMNFAFLFSGTVSTNAQLVVMEIFLVVAGANAGKIGLDHWVLPYLRGLFSRNKGNNTKDTPTISANHKTA